MSVRYPHRRTRPGITLIELLIVIFIMLLITGIAIPTLSPSVEQRRLRETSRLVTSFIQGARTRAIQTGRPVGIWIEEMSSLNEASTTMFYAEVPPLYGGDTVGATVTMSGTGTTRTLTGSFDPALVNAGDLVRLNYVGRLYQVTSDNATTITITSPNSADFPTNSSSGLPTYTFQVVRQPVKVAASSLTLPEGRVIDLGWSSLPNPSADVRIIIFTPGGQVSGVFDSASGFSTVPSPIFLLIGQVEKVVDDSNWFDLENLWVAIHPQTGLVTAAEVAAGDMDNSGVIDAADDADGDRDGDGDVDVNDSRYIVMTGVSMGGR